MCLGFVRLFICHGLLHALFFVVVSRTCMSLTVSAHGSSVPMRLGASGSLTSAMNILGWRYLLHVRLVKIEI